MSTAGTTLVGIITSIGGGAIPPVLALADGLKNRGHRVVLICDEASRSQATSRGMEALPISRSNQLANFFGPGPFQHWQETLRREDSLDDIQNPFGLFGRSASPEIADRVRDLRPELIFTCLFTLGLANELSRELEVPWCFVNPAFVDTPGRMRPIDQDFLDPVPRQIRKKWLPPILDEADLVLHATDWEYDPVTDEFPANHHQVGPLNLPTDSPPPGYLLDSGPPWALVSISTNPLSDEHDIVRHALESLSEKPLRVIATGPELAERFPDPPANARIETFAPHDEIMKRSRLVVSHAGHGAVMRGLVHGVPMVLVPQGKDQAGVAFRAERLGVAVVIERDELNQDSMESAVDRVLTDQTIRARSAEVAARLASEDPVAKACELVESLAARRNSCAFS